MLRKSANTFTHILISAAILALVMMSLPACQTLPVNPSSDNGTSADTPGLNSTDLLKYFNLAVKETVAAITLYEATKDATLLEKIAWWNQYVNDMAINLAAAQ